MSFKTKTILGIAFIEALFLSILVWQSIDLLARSNQQALIRQAQETADLFGTQIKNALISSDLATLAEMTEQLTQRGAVRYVRVIDSRGELAISNLPDQPAWAFQKDDSFDALDDGVYDVSSEVTEAGFYLGTVQLGLPIQSLVEFISASRKTLIGIAIAELLMVALASFFRSCRAMIAVVGRRWISSRIESWWRISRWFVGSSSSSTCGLWVSARAI